MYRDKTGKKWKIVIIAALIAAAAVLIVLFICKSPAVKGGDEEAALSIRTAVEQCALQCYAVEGAYPPNLQYMEEHYGLNVNTVDYYVTYDAYAQNQMPDVRVTKREH